MTRRTLLSVPLALLAETPARWIALNAAGDVRDANWPDAASPVNPGSLLKPFVALAYLATHREAPIVECSGAGCWRPQGHGRQDIVSAIANSCNVYFLELAAGVELPALDAICLSYGLSCPQRDWNSLRLIGLHAGWPQPAMALARAFAALAINRREVHVQTVLAGMAGCARWGTAAAVKLPCFAKTGTAPCSHGRRDCVDGYAVGIYPMDEPRMIVVAMRHNSTGANTARVIRGLVVGG